MSSIDEFADGLGGVLADIEMQFRSLSDLKLQVQTQANEVTANWSNYFAAQRAALTKAQDTLNRISNVPLTETPKVEAPKDQPLSQMKL